MNVMTKENLAQWGAEFPLTPGSLPDMTFVTAQGLKRQTADLSDLVLARTSKYGFEPYPAVLRLDIEGLEGLSG